MKIIRFFLLGLVLAGFVAVGACGSSGTSGGGGDSDTVTPTLTMTGDSQYAL